MVSAETTMSKKSLTEPPLPSLAVTCTETVCAAVGVPEKARDALGLGRGDAVRVEATR